MQLRRKNNMVYLRFSKLAPYPEVYHGVFTRPGRAGSPLPDGLAAGINGGNDPSAIRQNRSAIAGVFGGSELFFLSQVHQTGIVATGDFPAPETDDPCPPEADGAITTEPGRMLAIQIADCQSVMLFDPEKKAVANIHSGWRGSIGNIIGKCIRQMKDRFGTDPENLIAAISPSLGPCCAEFINFQTEIPARFHGYNIGSNRFNFWQISRDQLSGSGVRPSNIECANICTRCNTHLFFSYRKTRTTGRFTSVIGLVPDRNISG